MASDILVNTSSGNYPNQSWLSVWSCGIHLNAISRVELKICILDMNVKITNLILQLDLPGANESDMQQKAKELRPSVNSLWLGDAIYIIYIYNTTPVNWVTIGLSNSLWPVNSSPPSTAYKWNGSGLVQIMACRLVTVTGPSMNLFLMSRRSTVYLGRQSSAYKLKISLPTDQLLWLLVAYSAPSHYLNQCWIIVNWIHGNKFQWDSNQNIKLFVNNDASENIVCEMAAILCSGDVLEAEQLPADLLTIKP